MPKPPAECEIKETYLRVQVPEPVDEPHQRKARNRRLFRAGGRTKTPSCTSVLQQAYAKPAGQPLIAQAGKVMNRVIERQDRRCGLPSAHGVQLSVKTRNCSSGDGPIVQYRKMRDELKNRSGA
jgi:hypothetical protein